MFVEGIDYYIDDQGRYVFTEAAHLKRGYCCKNKCRHCPWHYGRQDDEQHNNSK